VSGGLKKEGSEDGMRRPINPMPTVTHEGNTYKLKSRKTIIPNFSNMTRFEALIWLNQNTRARGYSKAPNPLIGLGGAIQIN
jgi:hypothetical protein